MVKSFLVLFCLSVLLVACPKKKEEEVLQVSPVKNSEVVFAYKAPSANSEIYISNVDGSNPRTLTNDTNFENWWAKISPDRSKILFYRAPTGTNEDYAQADLMIMNADGSGLKILIPKSANAWTLQAHAEWSPSGQELVMCGTAAAAVHIFVTGADGTLKRQLTNTGGWNCDPAWSPDGTKIIFNRCAAANCHNTFGNLDIYTMSSVDGSNIVQLTAADGKDDYDPYYSPNGNEISWLYQVSNTGNLNIGVWSIKKMNANGSSQIFLINDGHINSKPSWSLDGAKIYFHRMVIPESGKFRFFQMNSNGLALQEILPFGAYGLSSVGNITYPTN